MESRAVARFARLRWAILCRAYGPFHGASWGEAEEQHGRGEGTGFDLCGWLVHAETRRGREWEWGAESWVESNCGSRARGEQWVGGNRGLKVRFLTGVLPNACRYLII
jgi:hypothetical protein